MHIRDLRRDALAALNNERGQLNNPQNAGGGQPAGAGPAAGAGAQNAGADGKGGQGTDAGAGDGGTKPGTFEDVARLFPEVHKKLGTDPVNYAKSYADLEKMMGRFSGELGMSVEDAFYALQGFLQQEDRRGDGGEGTEDAGAQAKAKDAERQQFLKDLASDPLAAIEARIEKRANELLEKRLAPLNKSQAVTQATVMWEQAAKTYPDIMEYHDTMVEMLEKSPALAGLENPIEGLYWLALFHPKHRDATIKKLQTEGRNRLLGQIREGTVEPGAGGGAPPMSVKDQQEKAVSGIFGAGPKQPALKSL